jgi:predicted RNA binding protein YcfA (HicA-like mRNA interferase family)
MAPHPSIKPKKLIKLLLSQGFYIHTQKGSHIKLKHVDDPKKIVIVPYHNKELKPKTLLSIIKSAGINSSEL